MLSATSLVHVNVCVVLCAWWSSLPVHIRRHIDRPSVARAFCRHLFFTDGCCHHTYGKVNTLPHI